MHYFMRQVKVLHLLYECRPSGAEVMLRLAAPFWMNWGCKLEIITIGSEEGDYAGELRQAGYTLTHLPMSRSPWEFFRWALKFRRLVRSIEPDIVVNHNETIHPALALLVAGIPKAQFRVVHNCFTFRSILRFRKRLERIISRLVGVRQIAISQAVQQTEWEQYRNPTVVLENWFDSEHFLPPTEDERTETRESLTIPKGCLVLVTVGNASIVKNYRVIIEALAMFPTRAEVLYLQVGREHPERQDRLLAESLGYSHRVRFCGPHKDVRPFLWAADLYLMPSLFEGFALSTAEAIACGVPCILADIPGLDHFQGAGPQIHFCPADSESIYRLISAMRASDASSSENRDSSGSNVVRLRFGLEAGALRYFNAWVHSIGGNQLSLTNPKT